MKFQNTFGSLLKNDTFLRRFISNRGGMVGLLILIFLSLTSVFAHFIAPYSPYAIVAKPYLQPSFNHLFGTDGIGRDIFSQMVYGTSLSLEIGFLSALGISAIGTVVGLVSGYVGHITGEIMMRFVDVMLVIPTIAFMVFVAALLGPGFVTILLVIIIFGWPPMSRMVRAQTLTLKNREFVESAVVSSASKTYILFRVIFPNLLSLILANGILAALYAIIADASLSFLGLASTNHYSWGTVLSNAEIEGAIYHNGLTWVVVPGLAIAITGIAITLVARAARQTLEPTT